MSKDIVRQDAFEDDLATSLKRYENYRRVLFAQVEPGRRMAAYGWRPLEQDPGPGLTRTLDVLAMHFKEMSSEFSLEIANYINSLVTTTYRLQAWSDLLDAVNDNGEKLDIMLEFVYPSVHYGLGLPYAIKQKFIFSFSHLSHQMRLLKSASQADDLPADGKITEKTLKRFMGDCDAGDRLLDAITAISSEDFSHGTMDFRHGFNHRITPGVEIGITNSVARNVIVGGTSDPFEKEMKLLGMAPLKSGEKRVIYGFGGGSPMTLAEVVSALKGQIEALHSCFELYKAFVTDHENWVISKHVEIRQAPGT